MGIFLVNVMERGSKSWKRKGGLKRPWIFFMGIWLIWPPKDEGVFFLWGSWWDCEETPYMGMSTACQHPRAPWLSHQHRWDLRMMSAHSYGPGQATIWPSIFQHRTEFPGYTVDYDVFCIFSFGVPTFRSFFGVILSRLFCGLQESHHKWWWLGSFVTISLTSKFHTQQLSIEHMINNIIIKIIQNPRRGSSSH